MTRILPVTAGIRGNMRCARASPGISLESDLSESSKNHNKGGKNRINRAKSENPGGHVTPDSGCDW